MTIVELLTLTAAILQSGDYQEPAKAVAEAEELYDLAVSLCEAQRIAAEERSKK